MWSLVLLCLTGGALSVGAAVAARHQAGTAADLAALAAADRVFDDPGEACAAGRRIAARHGSVLTFCQVDGEFVDVVAEVPLRGLLKGFGPVRVASRAGPAEPSTT
jgi:secretion/DNA translocation related TadE-like protein